jgi:uncharacterized protein YjbI with pentapeptide repeats
MASAFKSSIIISVNSLVLHPDAIFQFAAHQNVDFQIADHQNVNFQIADRQNVNFQIANIEIQTPLTNLP